MTTVKYTPQEAAELEALNDLAQREHQAGRLAEAAAAYRKLLAHLPDHADLCHELGNVLMAQGQVDEAAAQFERAVALNPEFFQMYNMLGCILAGQGKFDQALDRFQQAIALRPDYTEAHYNLGNVLLDQGKLDEAAARFEQVVALRPDYAEAHYVLGNVLLGQGKLSEAATRFEKVVALRPDSTEAHLNLGVTLGSLGRFVEAAARLEQAIALRPDYAEAHNNLGNVLRQQGKLDLAAERFQQAVALRPNFAQAYNNLGNVLREQGNLDQAVAQYAQALALQPNYAEGHYNLGFALREQGQLDEAAAQYQQALALRPDYADAQLGLAACYLIEGDFERGWPMYEGRLRVPGFVTPCSLPRWQGESPAGRSLLLLCEQGLGDTLHFLRYARLLKERGARIVLACQPPLGRLLAAHPDIDELFLLGSAAELPSCDFCLPLLSAPGMFGTTVATIPADVPYLWADPALTAAWHAELANLDGFKIGIVWQGSRDYPSDRLRSFPLAQFAPLARPPGVRLISLQKGFGAEQIATVDFPVLDLSDRLDHATGPFMDTAAVIRNLDLVITPDTAIAHLAGALGTPIWLALQFSATWRWLQHRDDSPWYPTMRIFRQTAIGQWPNVFDRMAHAIEAQRSETS